MKRSILAYSLAITQLLLLPVSAKSDITVSIKDNIGDNEYKIIESSEEPDASLFQSEEDPLIIVKYAKGTVVSFTCLDNKKSLVSLEDSTISNQIEIYEDVYVLLHDEDLFFSLDLKTWKPISYFLSGTQGIALTIRPPEKIATTESLSTEEAEEEDADEADILAHEEEAFLVLDQEKDEASPSDEEPKEAPLDSNDQASE